MEGIVAQQVKNEVLKTGVSRRKDIFDF